MKDVMTDLETMGTDPNAAIVAIGAVEFDTETGELGDSFYVPVDLASSVRCGGVIDASTVLWWLQQSDEARREFARGGKHIADALQQFAAWMCYRGEYKEVRMWGNGAAFDNVILASAYRRNGTHQPWAFYNDRCYRTMKAQHPDVPMQRSGTHHNALDDAKSQARHLLAILASTRKEVA